MRLYFVDNPLDRSAISFAGKTRVDIINYIKSFTDLKSDKIDQSDFSINFESIKPGESGLILNGRVNYFNTGCWTF